MLNPVNAEKTRLIRTLPLILLVILLIFLISIPVSASSLKENGETAISNNSVYSPTNNNQEDDLYLDEENQSGNFLYSVNNGEVTITGYNGTGSGNLVIPNTIEGLPVTRIGESAFSLCTGFTGSLTIPNSVTSIGNSAFSGCDHLTGSLTIPNNVTEIGEAAFNGCSGFTGSLTIPNSVTSIGTSAFSECTGFTGPLTLSNRITEIRPNSFSNCSELTGPLTIPNGVTKIGKDAFFRCEKLSGTLTIPNSVTEIGERAFYICSGFTGSLTIPNSVTKIEISAFQGCAGINDTLTIGTGINTVNECFDYNDFKRIINNSNIDIGLDPGLVFPNVDYFWVDEKKPDEAITIIKKKSSAKKRPSITNMSMNITDARVEVGDTIQLAPYFTPANAIIPPLVWTTTNDQVATVDNNGFVTIVGNGHAQIYATPDPRLNAYINISAFCNLYVGGENPEKGKDLTNKNVSTFIERLYTVALDRASEETGKTYWNDKVTVEGTTGADLARGFLYSDEFLNKSTSDSEFLDVLYKTFFNRPADEAGKNGWLEKLSAGTDRKEIVDGFIDSTEFANLCLTYGISSGSAAKPNITVTPSKDIIDFSTRLYSTCLGRTPDADGLNYWSVRIANQQVSGSTAAEGFFFSEEFQNGNYSDEEYVTRLYKTFFDREPDEGGFATWTGKLREGATRKEVFDGFANSTEWARLCARYGIMR